MKICVFSFKEEIVSTEDVVSNFTLSADPGPTPAPAPDHECGEPPDSAGEQLETLRKHVKQLEAAIAVLSSHKFGIQHFSTDPELIQFYTGFRTNENFVATFDSLKPAAGNTSRWNQFQIPDISGNIQFKNGPFITKCFPS